MTIKGGIGLRREAKKILLAPLLGNHNVVRRHPSDIRRGWSPKIPRGGWWGARADPSLCR